MDRTDNTLRILVTVLSILFLLIIIKTSYPAKSIGDMTINIAGKFIICELILFSSIYVGGSILSEAVPGLWESMQKLHLKQKPIPTSLNNTSADNDNSEDDNDDEIMVSMEDEIPDEIVVYTNKTFENILHSEQIEKLFSNLKNFNNGEKFEVIEKEVLPDYIFQFDILHFVWNICKRIYVKKHAKFKFRDRAAEFAKFSFPLTVTSTLESIGSTMTNDDKTHSLPIIKPGNPLVPHDFSEVKKQLERTS